MKTIELDALTNFVGEHSFNFSAIAENNDWIDRTVVLSNATEAMLQQELTRLECQYNASPKHWVEMAIVSDDNEVINITSCS